MSMEVTLSGNTLKKVFNRRSIFDDVSFKVVSGQTLLITGPNGSGKSTLVKIISGVLTASAGHVDAKVDGTDVGETMYRAIGLVSPYLQMYEEFSPRENLEFVLSARGLNDLRGRIQPLLEELQLKGRIDDPVRTYSSGMKQRVKFAFALIHQPPVLILDEPMSNLDAKGIEMVKGIMDAQRQQGILVVATNDVTDVRVYDQRIDLGR
jgi:heme exporter protein A